jgi:hypothetical protein
VQKPKAPNKGKKEEQTENTQVQVISAKTQRGLERGKRTNYIPKPPPIVRSMLEKEREGKPKSTINL